MATTRERIESLMAERKRLAPNTDVFSCFEFRELTGKAALILIENATLFAAAEELLDACIAVDDLLLRSDAETKPNRLVTPTEDEWYTVVARVKIAIAKTQGAA